MYTLSVLKKTPDGTNLEISSQLKRDVDDVDRFLRFSREIVPGILLTRFALKTTREFCWLID